MNISISRQSLAAPTPINGQSLPLPTTAKQNIDTTATDTSGRYVDMTNVSLNEINELIKSGVDGLLDVCPCNPGSVIGQSGSDYDADVKIDFLAQIKGSIDYKKSINEDTRFLEGVLENVKKIDGMKMPESIHVVI